MTPQQPEKLQRLIGPRCGWLHALRRRMEQHPITPTDPVYLAVVAAADALQSLHVVAHYRASGVGASGPDHPVHPWPNSEEAFHPGPAPGSVRRRRRR